METNVKTIDANSAINNNIFMENGIEDATDVESILQSTLTEYGEGADYDDFNNVVDKDGKLIVDADTVSAKIADAIKLFKEGKADATDSQDDNKGDDNDNNNDSNKSDKDNNKTDKDDVRVIDLVMETVGVKLTNEDGTPLTFDDTAESIGEYVNKVIEAGKEEIKTNIINDLFKTDPELVLAYDHYKKYNTLKNFSTHAVSYQNLDINKMDDNQKLASIKELYLVKGMPAVQVEGIASTIKPGETLNTMAANAVEELKKIEKDRNAAAVATITAEKQAKDQARIEHINNVTKLVKSGKLSNININDKDQEGFLAYLFTPVKDGKTQEMLDYEKLTTEQNLYYSYKMFKKIDDTTTAAAVAKSMKLKDLLSKKKPEKTGSSSTDKDAKGFVNNMNDFSLSDVKE